jgi:pyruvate,orthophosphate dikinase
MPGMMDTFLNVGINKEICESLSKKPGFEWAAWDCYRRFLQSWGMNEGLDRNFFDHIIDNFKTRFNVTKKLLFSPSQMKEIALTYRDEIQKQGITIFDKPEDQLKYAIMQTFASWNSNRAKVYRKQMNISDEWGTAVTIMSMIFGNLNEEAGSGVTFTRDPNGQSRELQLFGDFFFGVQGDDIVSGLIETYPISEAQRIKEKRNSDISLESHFPQVYKKLYNLAATLIKQKGFSAQEIEFTFENSTENGLYILQTRDQYQEKESLELPFKATPELEKSYVGNGVGVSGGALAGRVVFSEEEIKKWRELEPYNPLILIRPDTVPEDVSLLLHVEGLLTARGGRTSHAAVTIPQLKKVGVVGFSKLKVYERDSYCFIGDHRLKSGDYLSIDGRSGSVYLGLHQPEDQ